MSIPPVSLNHAEKLLAELLSTFLPADSVVSRYFRQHRNIGHRERGMIAENVYAVLRHKRSLDARCFGEATPRRLLLAKLACVDGLNRRELESVLREGEGEWLAQAKGASKDSWPPAVRLDWPDWLYERLAAVLAPPELEALAASLNQTAPLDLRVNVFKLGRDELLQRLRDDSIEARPCPYSPIGIRLAGKPSLSHYPPFMDGWLEVQDEGSQLLGFLLQPKRGEMVADFCAGAGGKTLMLGAMMRSQGRLYAFDVAQKRLAKLKPRLRRSGLSNVHPVLIESERDLRIRRLAGKMDRVLVDAPCSGLGTLRRNPDLKWKQTPASVAELACRQAAILAAASALVKKGGRLVYATCSLLAVENEDVVATFLAAHPDFCSCPVDEILRRQGIVLDETSECLRLFPHRHGCDGFFAAVMERQ